MLASSFRQTSGNIQQSWTCTHPTSQIFPIDQGCLIQTKCEPPMWATHTIWNFLVTTFVFFLIHTKILCGPPCLGGKYSQTTVLLEWVDSGAPIWPNSVAQNLEGNLTVCTRTWGAVQVGRVGLWNEQPILLGDWSPHFMRAWATTTKSSNHIQMPVPYWT